MPSARTSLLAAVLALALVACKRPSADECEKAIRNWYTLVFWDQAEKEIAAAPPEKRDELRKAKLAERDQKLAAGIEQGIMDCRSSRDFEGVKCMKEAMTAADALKCRAAKKP